LAIPGEGSAQNGQRQVLWEGGNCFETGESPTLFGQVQVAVAVNVHDPDQNHGLADALVALVGVLVVYIDGCR
jgi:hypothetical protein